MDRHHGRVEQVPGPLDGGGSERRPTAEEDAPPVWRQPPVVQEVARVEEHPSVGVHRCRHVGVEHLGGDHVAAEGEDAPSQPPHQAAVGRAVGRHHHLAAAQRTSRRLDLEALPALLQGEDGGRPVEPGPGGGGGARQTGRQLGGMEPGAALDEEASAEPVGTDLRSQLGAGEEAGLLTDRRIGIGDGALRGGHTGMVGQLDMTTASPVELDAELGGEGAHSLEGVHGVVPQPAPVRLGEELRHIVLSPGMCHAAVATARSGPDVVTIQDHDVAPAPADLQGGRQPRVPTTHHHHIRAPRQRRRRGLRELDVVPPIRNRLVPRCQGGGPDHGARFAPGGTPHNKGARS